MESKLFKYLCVKQEQYLIHSYIFTQFIFIHKERSKNMLFIYGLIYRPFLNFAKAFKNKTEFLLVLFIFIIKYRVLSQTVDVGNFWSFKLECFPG